jgi:peroxiredoxin
VTPPRPLLLASAGILVTLIVGAVVLQRTGRELVTAQRAQVRVPADKDPWIGRPAPDFTLESLDGRRISLHDLRGKVVLVNFWATWCAPCRVEMPWLMDFSTRYRSQGLEVIGVSVDDGNPEKVRKFVQDMRVNYSIVLQDDKVVIAYGGVRFLPQTFFVDRNGTVTAHSFGIHGKDDFEADIQRSLSGPSS